MLLQLTTIAKCHLACTNSETMRRILVIRFSSLGDIILTFPTLAQLAKDGGEIHFLTKEAYRPLVELVPGIKQIHTISNHADFRELYEKSKRLKQHQFDLVMDLHRNTRSAIATLLLNRPSVRISKHRLKEVFLYIFRGGLFRAIGLTPISRPLEALRLIAKADHEVSESTSISSITAPLAHIKLKANDHTVVVDIMNQFSKLSFTQYICVAMESAWPQKQWDQQKFIDIAKRAVAHGVGVVWLGLKPVPTAAVFEGTIDCTTKLSIPAVGAALGGATMLLSNDSGLMHLSEAIGTPVAAVFGPTTRELGFAPRLRHSKIIDTRMWCRPCSKTGRWCIRPVEKQKCLKTISVDQVWSAVVQILYASTSAPMIKNIDAKQGPS